MHNESHATTWFDRLTTELSERNITAQHDAPRSTFVRVPWHQTWGFTHQEATAADVDGAVARARGALREWRTGEDVRRQALTSLADALAEHIELFTHLISFENGKLFPAASMEANAAVGSLRYHAGLPIPEQTLRDDEAVSLKLVREPLGVVVAVTPSNMPLLMLVNKLASALLMGNTVIAKPSPDTPFSALLLQQIAQPILPEGVFQVLAGGIEVGRSLVEHPGTNMVTLTGSRRAGKEVMASAASSLTRLQLELGGNDAAIVLEDADLSRIAPDIFRSAFASSGQACVATKRVYVPRGLLPALTEHLTTLAAATRVGSPYDAEATHPVVTSNAQHDRVQSLIAAAQEEGATIFHGDSEQEPYELGIRPTIVTAVSETSELVLEEQFGPVLPIVAYDDLGDVVDTVNAGPYGLGATVWTANQEAGERIARQLQVGMTWVNRTPAPDPSVPFGGMRESGMGREGGQAGLDAYCELKTIGMSGAHNG